VRRNAVSTAIDLEQPERLSEGGPRESACARRASRASHDLVGNAAGSSVADLHFEDMSARGRHSTCLVDLVDDWIDQREGPFAPVPLG